jgi:uncharacterized protein (TIGR02217 family)
MFIETPRFPDNIAYGAVGGAAFNTDVVVLGSGFEQRNINWNDARARWDVSHGIKIKADMANVIAFHRAMKGRAHGFRFKDWSDYQTTVTDGILTRVAGTADQYQIYKHYVAGSLTDARKITKPVAGKVQVYRNGSTYASVVDTATGIVTLGALSTKAITGITKATNGVATIVGHGLPTGSVIKITGVVGMTQVNNQVFTVTSTGVDTVQLNVNTSAYTSYSSGGSAILYAATSDVLRVVCEFDVPVRFDDDALPVGYLYRDVLEVSSIPVVELRL